MTDLILQSTALDPSFLELVWTLAVTTLLLVAGTITVWVLPWSDQELETVHREIILEVNREVSRATQQASFAIKTASTRSLAIKNLAIKAFSEAPASVSPHQVAAKR